MSVRAYRVESKIVKNRVWSSAVSTPTFNCWDDEGFSLSTFISNHEDSADHRSSEGGGIITVTAKVLKDAIKKAKSLKISDKVLSMLKIDLKVMEESGEEYLDYECF